MLSNIRDLLKYGVPALIVWGALAALLIMSSSCVMFEPIEPHYITAERLTYNAVSKHALVYLGDDADLPDDVRADRYTDLAAWDAFIAQGETDADNVLKRDHLLRERELFNDISPWYLGYIAADDGISESEKESRVDTILSWDFRLTRAERAAGIRAPPENNDE